MLLSILGLLFLLIPLAYLLASVVGLSYLWYRVIKVKRGSDLPTCATCGYGVRGLAGLECPECGADLREVGITTPKQRGVVSPVLFVLMWTLLLPGPSCFVSGILAWVGPKTQYPNHSLELKPIQSGEYISVSLGHSAGMGIGVGASSSLNVEGNNSQYEYLEIDPVAMTYEDWSSNPSPTTQPSAATHSGPGTKPLDRQAILDTLNRAGADITKTHVINEADEVLTIIRGIPTVGLNNLSTTYFSQSYYNYSHDEPAGWFVLLLLLAWIAVWIGGLVMFFRVRKKQLPEVHRGALGDKPRFAQAGGISGGGGSGGRGGTAPPTF